MAAWEDKFARFPGSRFRGDTIKAALQGKGFHEFRVTDDWPVGCN
ncbi:hypothetical protein DFP92_11438 [Yoonia sediminilitoris]|uniref:Uncharacterized protein n=1 Tax=Yoonia sediminilitoris TaxID=1286148 RepID=A0A2T6K983_9RHOB|nr:hypothetical protein C8N45_11438 [Yoonia sediminilitoris]RCW91082.1 hypothetical protein DFP92_11438 [Yoonia sediminilitoris]